MEGECPKCKSDDLDYENDYKDGECLIYPFECNNCGSRGRELFRLDYIESEVDNG